jgi:hypothetical protein
MKKIAASFLCLGLMMSSMSLTAQNMTGGLKGGLTMSNLYIDKNELNDENARFGFNAGLYSQFMIAGIFGIQPELLFSTKGTEAVYDGIINQSVQFNMNYIDVPVLAIFSPLPLLEFYAGPYVGLLINSNVKYTGLINDESEINRDHFNTFDFGFTGGVALNVNMVKVGLRYNLGLQKLANSDTANMLLGDSKNSYGQLYIALKLSD